MEGSLCKHLLAALIELVKSGQMKPQQVLSQVIASRGQRFVLDKKNKELMTGPIASSQISRGVFDWRPGQIMPEDFYM